MKKKNPTNVGKKLKRKKKLKWKKREKQIHNNNRSHVKITKKYILSTNKQKSKKIGDERVWRYRMCWRLRQK
jgi:hypothetical protein